jgi:hypothetical protein
MKKLGTASSLTAHRRFVPFQDDRIARTYLTHESWNDPVKGRSLVVEFGTTTARSLLSRAPERVVTMDETACATSTVTKCARLIKGERTEDDDDARQRYPQKSNEDQ